MSKGRGFFEVPVPIEILLVEDDPAYIRLAQETLREHKLLNPIHVATDGESALAYLRGEGRYAGRRLPDLVLLDIHLPKVSGIEVLAAMKADERFRDVAVAVMMVTETDRQLVEGAGLPAGCYIHKPLTFDQYLEALRC